MLLPAWSSICGQNDFEQYAHEQEVSFKAYSYKEEERMHSVATIPPTQVASPMMKKRPFPVLPLCSCAMPGTKTRAEKG